MIKTLTEVHVERPRDHTTGRQPLRVEIGRRRARTRAGSEKFVTQVRFGGAEAVVIPWRDGRPAVQPD